MASRSFRMHGSAGLHSAMAIKRQRRQRLEAKKRLERRLSSRTNSTESVAPPQPSHQPPSMATSIGMLHIGVCFFVLGLFLIGSGLLPDDLMSWRGHGLWNELVGSGIFVALLGLFLIGLNRVVTRREENELNNYVQRQLQRSKSGHRLERDVETGCLTTKHHRRLLELRKEEDGVPVPVHGVDAPHLDKIPEEDAGECRGAASTTTTASLSPGTPSETRELITNRQYSFNSRQY